MLYTAEGGDGAQRREAILDFIQSNVADENSEPLLLCGDIDTNILRRLRPFRPIILSDISDDSGFSLEELSFLCAHQAKILRVLGEDDFTHLFSFLRPDQFQEVRSPNWARLIGFNEGERTERLALARQCLQAGAGDRLEALLADRNLGSEAELYLALGHLQASELGAVRYYYSRLQDAGIAMPSNIRRLIESSLNEPVADTLPKRRSFALNDLDLKLKPYLGDQAGVFIEAGGNDGISQSNTLYFERYHQWRGILIEGIPELAQKCLTNRPRAWVEQCALVPFDFEKPTISMTYCNLMSVVDGAMKTPEEEAAHIATGEEVQQLQRYKVDVRTKTLSAIIEAYGAPKIDLLSLDVEGYELQVLQGLDLERHGPSWMLIEARYRSDIDNYLVNHYEVVAELSHHDVLYRRR